MLRKEIKTDFKTNEQSVFYLRFCGILQLILLINTSVLQTIKRKLQKGR